MQLDISCSEMVRRLDDYLDRALSPAELEAVEAHLHECVICAGKFRFEASLMDGLRERLHRITAPDHLLERIHQRLATELAG